MSERKSNRPKIIQDFITSLGTNFEAKIWILTKIKKGSRPSARDIFEKSCSTLMSSGYSYEELESLLGELIVGKHVEANDTRSIHELSPKTDYNLTNLFFYIIEIFEKKGNEDIIAADILKCGYEEREFLVEQLEGYGGKTKTTKADILLNLCIKNAIPFGVWIQQIIEKTLHVLPNNG